MSVCSAKRKHLGPEGSSGVLLCRAVVVWFLSLKAASPWVLALCGKRAPVATGRAPVRAWLWSRAFPVRFPRLRAAHRAFTVDSHSSPGSRIVHSSCWQEPCRHRAYSDSEQPLFIQPLPSPTRLKIKDLLWVSRSPSLWDPCDVTAGFFLCCGEQDSARAVLTVELGVPELWLCSRADSVTSATSHAEPLVERPRGTRKFTLIDCDG